MKKLFCTALALILCLSAIGCGQKKEDPLMSAIESAKDVNAADGIVDFAKKMSQVIGQNKEAFDLSDLKNETKDESKSEVYSFETVLFKNDFRIGLVFTDGKLSFVQMSTSTPVTLDEISEISAPIVANFKTAQMGYDIGNGATIEFTGTEGEAYSFIFSKS